jgi:P-type conjugative transfer protein TrbJ
MPNCSRRFFLLGTAAAAVSVGTAIALRPAPASAVVFVCANCSTIWQQIMEYAQQVYSVGVQLQQYRTQIMQYMNMVQNTLALPKMLWNFVTSDIQQIRNLANIGKLLTGNAGGVLGKIAQFDAAASQVLNLPDMVNKYNSWSQMTGENIVSLQRSMGMAQSQMVSDADLAMQIQAQSGSAVGQMQVLQAANEFSSLSVKQTMALHQTMMGHAQAVSGYMASQTARQAEADQAGIGFLSQELQPMTGGKRY